uniref:Integrase core domain containing protein n=1 Tax=Solanum tuberosum TaxID=4113 RepID=M1DSL9_SOLTU
MIQVTQMHYESMTFTRYAFYFRAIIGRMTKDQIEEDQERDENMAKMMTQMDLLSIHVIGSGSKVLNGVGVYGVTHDDADFEDLELVDRNGRKPSLRKSMSYPNEP